MWETLEDLQTSKSKSGKKCSRDLNETYVNLVQKACHNRHYGFHGLRQVNSCRPMGLDVPIVSR